MARKSNKTEHVLKLITKDEELLESLNEKNDPEPEKIQSKPEIIADEPELPSEQLSGPPPSEPPLADEKKQCLESVVIEHHFNLINLAELIVSEKVGLVMERMKVCPCPMCVNDVLALALNSLPTKYVTTDAGKQHFQLDAYKKQYETDVLAALTKACVRVKASPRHS